MSLDMLAKAGKLRRRQLTDSSEEAPPTSQKEGRRRSSQKQQAMLTKEDLGDAWVTDDMEDRINFLQKLGERGLPMPKNEGQVA